MTSNQIAYASVQEEKRHNEVVEKETGRHNKVVEDLDTYKANVDASYKENITRLEAEKIQVQKDYNSWYARWTEASGTEKLRIEKQMANANDRANEIKSELNELTQQYNEDIVGIQQLRANEDARHNGEMEALQSTNLDLQKKLQDLQRWQADTNAQIAANELQYKNNEMLLRNNISQQEIEIQRLHETNSLLIAEINANASKYGSTAGLFGRLVDGLILKGKKKVK